MSSLIVIWLLIGLILTFRPWIDWADGKLILWYSIKNKRGYIILLNISNNK